MFRRAIRPAAAAAAIALSTASVAAAKSPTDLKTELQRKIQALQSQLADDELDSPARAPGGGNHVLAHRHRVGLCGWPIYGATMIGDPRAASVDAVFRRKRGTPRF